jgi:transaldolase
MNPAQQLHASGQSLWLDSISRRMLTSGTLAHYIEDLAVTGLISNPTILGHAMAASSDYDESLKRHLATGIHEPQELIYASRWRTSPTRQTCSVPPGRRPEA